MFTTRPITEMTRTIGGASGAFRRVRRGRGSNPSEISCASVTVGVARMMSDRPFALRCMDLMAAFLWATATGVRVDGVVAA
jgi:hypothetical protein